MKDLTFLEIFNENGWNLNISVTDSEFYDKSVLLNYLTTPNVLVWSGVLASASAPILYNKS